MKFIEDTASARLSNWTQERSTVLSQNRRRDKNRPCAIRKGLEEEPLAVLTEVMLKVGLVYTYSLLLTTRNSKTWIL